MANAAIYARVSTEDQDLDTQSENLLEYARDLGLDVDAEHVLADKSTGTNTDRAGFRQLIELVEDDDVDAVVVRSITRISRNMRDLHRTVGTIVEDHNCGLYIRNDDLEIPPGDDLDMRDKILLNTLGMAAELEADMIRQRVVEGLRAAEEAGKWTTRPPYGFTTDEDGYLQPTDEFSNAVDAIVAVEEEDWSHRKASRHSGVPRRTIPNLLERKELYLEEYSEVK
mgnify:CR=1 FL=1